MPDCGRADLMEHGFKPDPAIKGRPIQCWLADCQKHANRNDQLRDVHR
jgi:hypothetical protein